jgi:NADPH:quinone reductase-like Zn-dependent oxidoreductase
MRPVVSRVYDLEETAAAHTAMETRETLGKTVIRIARDQQEESA